MTNKIWLKNYKSFDSIGSGFEQIKRINIIIGKNNSGKSSLIELISYLSKPNSNFLNKGRDNNRAEVLITDTFTENIIQGGFSISTSGGPIRGNHYSYGKKLIGHKFTYQLLEDGKKEFISTEYDSNYNIENNIRNSINRVNQPFWDKTFCHISAERDIKPEKADSNSFSLDPNGSYATRSIAMILNRVEYDRQIIEKDLLEVLNSILVPDISFKRLFVQQISDQLWEIFFEDNNGSNIALSKMGSGIKTVILVLLNLLVRPILEKKKPSTYIYAFEELENNLHPSLQRRLYNYIEAFSKINNSIFFITTHSNIVIDTFGSNSESQIIHVLNDSKKALTKTVLSFEDQKKILNDLDVRASDLLQSNGIIWVEGPSDRIYINKWINICEPNLHEGFHYMIMFYGGKLLSHLSFDDDWLNNEFIPLLKINTNSFVVIDKDRKRAGQKINDTKNRIESEIGEKNCWITKGIEIENYLNSQVIENWLRNKYQIAKKVDIDKFDKFEQSISNVSSIKYASKKNYFSREISEFITEESLNYLDLEPRLNQLITEIRKWNSI